MNDIHSGPVDRFLRRRLMACEKLDHGYRLASSSSPDQVKQERTTYHCCKQAGGDLEREDDVSSQPISHKKDKATEERGGGDLRCRAREAGHTGQMRAHQTAEA